MCLSNLTTENPKVAKRDIPCYKVLEESLISPYEGYKYVLGKKEKSPLDKGISDVHKGLHTFTSKKNAIIERNWFLNRDFGSHNVFKAIIPKGAKYFIGETEDDQRSYASNELIVLEKL